MSESIEYNGKIYRRYPESSRRSDRVYFKRSITGGTVWLHRQKWIDAHGDIPAGHHVHHKDGNPSNNDISNLECLSPKDHFGDHQWSKDRKSKHKKHLDKIRPLTKAWHSSPEGIQKHREIGAMAYENFVPVQKKCEHCGAGFLCNRTGGVGKFCSNKCKSAYRRASGVDNETRLCAQCGSAFVADKYADTKCCSRSCAVGLRLRKG